MQIKRISLSKLLKMELPELVEDVIRVAEKHDTKALHIDGMLKMLLHNKNQIQLLTTPYGVHPLTAEIEKMHKQRIIYAGSISTQMQGITRANLTNLSNEIKVAKHVVRDYLRGLRNYNRKVVDVRLNNFFEKIDAQPTLKDALTTIGLMPYVESLRVADEKKKKLLSERVKSISERTKGSEAKAIQKNGQAILRSFFEQISLAQITYPQLDYEPLISELNRVLVQYTNLINRRAGVYKKETDKENAPETTELVLAENVLVKPAFEATEQDDLDKFKVTSN